jgi:hypothetical protein
MAINFPNSPTLNEEFTAGDRTWIWDGTVWNSKETAFTTPGIPTGGATAQLLAKVDGADYNTEWKTSDGVRSFADASARATAIPSPTVGMYTHLEDAPQRTQFWNGSAWVSPFGSTLLSSTNFTNETRVSVDNIFTSEYTYYDFFISVVCTSSTGFSARLRTGGGSPADLSSSTYTSQRFFAENTTVGAFQDVSAAQWALGSVRTNGVGFIRGSIANPFVVGETQILSHQADRIATGNIGLFSGYNTSSASYAGFAIIPGAGTITGNITIHGRRV